MMSTRVILIHPPFPANERHKRVLPLGLAYLASYLKQARPHVAISIVDAHALDLSCDAAVDRIGALVEKGAHTILGIGYWTLQAPFAYELCSRVKKKWTSITIVHGGAHASVMPEESLRFADCVVLHEGEITFAEFVAAIEGGESPAEIRGCAWKNGEITVINPPRDFIDDLDSLPFPAWEMLEMDLYDTPMHVTGGKRVPVIGSRGCPYNCIYCASPFMWKRRLRWRSPANVLDEIEEIIRRYHIAQIHFWDDNLMLERSYIEGLCEGISRRGMAVRWTGLTRPSHVVKNADLMPLLKRSGCIGLEIGIESANPETFAEIGKNEDLGQIIEVAALHKKNGMYPMFTYMAFNPGETIYGYWKQARFIDTMLAGLPPAKHFQPTPFPVYIGQFCTPHVGTELFRQAPQKGVVLNGGWEDRYHHQINFVPHSLLSDVPLKLKRRLKEAHYRLLNYLIQVAFWSDFNRSRTEEEQRRELGRFRAYATEFYRMCRGRLSVGRIASRLRRRLDLEEPESIRFAALLSYILAQMGLIRSASDDASREMHERHIANEEEIPALLAPPEAMGWRGRLRRWFRGENV
ncbi:MAG: radical SAM protein [Candidatus Aureabacteria bacterium]|nr:radical SAM protein [Candidatus Auribacterota bacterium]